MSIWLNVSNMKINHRSRKSHMSEALLHVYYVLSVFQKMRGRTVPQFVDGDGMVECDPRQCVLEDDSHIAWSDALWLCLASMTLEDIVVARILLPICLEHDDHLVGNGHVAVFTSLALEDKQLLAVKADVVPSEAACLADPEGAVVDDGKQGFVVQGAVADKTSNLLLGEHSEKQHCLSNFQAIVIDTAVCILCQTQLLSKKRNAVPEFGYSRDRLVQCCIGHGYLWWRGLMTGL